MHHSLKRSLYFGMKKSSLKKSGILIILSLSVLFTSCLNWIIEKPSFMIRGIILSPRSSTEMNLLLNLEVQNPNRFDLTLKSFEYAFYLKGEEIGNGRLEKEFLLPSSSTTQVQVPISAKFKDLGEILKAIFTGSDLPYMIEGKADVETALGNLNFPFSKGGHINLTK